MTFDDIEIDTEQFELRRSGVPVAVEPKVFDLIRFMVENPNRVLTKDEMIEAVWQGRIVSDAALSSAVKSARRALGDDLATSRIRTVRGRGFLMKLDTVADAPGASVAPKVFIQPSFVVLPPKDMPASVNGVLLQRRVSTAMARIPFLTVVAPSIARSLDDCTPEALRRVVGHGFALEIMGRGDGMDCLMFDVQTGGTLWSQELDCAPEINAMLDMLVLRLEPQLVGSIQKSSQMSSTDSDPRMLTMQAMGTMALKGWNRNSFEEAENKLRQALEIDSELAYARASIALIMALGQRMGLVEPDAARRNEAISHAERAIELDPTTPNVLGLAGCALVDAGQGLRGKAVLERGVSLDPNNAQSLAALGVCRIIDKELEPAVEMLTKAIRVSPHDGRLAVWGSMLALAYMQVGQLEAALTEAQRAVAADDRTHLSRIVLSSAHLQNGDISAAKDAWSDALRVTPDLAESQLAAVVGRRVAKEMIQALST